MDTNKLKAHIGRMEQELKEVDENYDRLQDFFYSEQYEKITDEKQRELLALQSNYMYDYIEVLKERIEYDKIKE